MLLIGVLPTKYFLPSLACAALAPLIPIYLTMYEFYFSFPGFSLGSRQSSDQQSWRHCTGPGLLFLSESSWADVPILVLVHLPPIVVSPRLLVVLCRSLNSSSSFSSLGDISLFCLVAFCSGSSLHRVRMSWLLSLPLSTFLL